MTLMRPILLAFPLYATAMTADAQSREVVFGILHDRADIEMQPDTTLGGWRCKDAQASICARFDARDQVERLSLSYPLHSVELVFSDNADGTRGVTRLISGDGDEKRELQTWERVDDPVAVITQTVSDFQLSYGKNILGLK
jgi:hypothetical protein